MASATGQASQLLEKLIAATSGAEDLNAWAAEQLGVEAAQGEQALAQCSRLVATLMAGDTRLMERLRQTIQKRAACESKLKPNKRPKPKAIKIMPLAAQPNRAKIPLTKTLGLMPMMILSVIIPRDILRATLNPSMPAAEPVDADASVQASSETSTAEGTPATAATAEPTATDSASESVTASETSSSASGEVGTSEIKSADSPSGEAAAGDANTGEPPISLTFESGKKGREAKLLSGKRKDREKPAAKSVAKLTPRQRRRRWLSSVLQPLKSLKKPLNRLTAYQMLMLGRGQRSQLIKVELDYDRRQLVNMARDVFVNDQHPFAKWFAQACEHALTSGLYAKVEADALAEEDEIAQQKLLEAATDQLRSSLLQRPVKGHRILVVDPSGPNAACVAIIDARGRCLATARSCLQQSTIGGQPKRDHAG